MSRKALLIINPISGTKSKEGLAETVVNRLGEAGFDIDVAVTQCQGDATRLAREAVGSGFDTVLAAGGDGTVNEVAASLCHTGVILGIIPCGSGNGLARHLSIPVDIERSLQIIIGGRVLEADFATVNDRPFFCTFGVGFDAEVSDRFAHQPRRGKLSYLQSTLQTYLKYHPQIYTITTDDEVVTKEAFLVAVCNASQYGNNAYIAPEASITDGLLDVTIIHSGNPFSTVKVGMDLMAGMLNSNTRFESFRTSKLTITRSEHGPSHIDGEPISDLEDTMYVECHKGALKVYAPDELPPFRPLLTPINSMMQDLRIALEHIFNH